MASIKTVAETTGLSIPTIRYYDELGLLPHLKRDVHGYRQFDAASYRDLELVICFRQVGIPIAEIVDLLGPQAPNEAGYEHRLAALNQQEARLKQQQIDLETARLALLVKKARYTALLADPNSHAYDQAAIVAYFVHLAKPTHRAAVDTTLTTVFNQLATHQVPTTVLDDTFQTLQTAFPDHERARVQAALHLLTGLND
ncbi:MerR family transcriptional regulator [Lactiplantibacillus carotarum]|uniref:MerR family transcriptional regulator n=1 Tax=Lactiplantibacillus carotarum TaxID=2993456 RepID=UPI00298F39E7|nr:MerR family transcriptional regulator [Lactiplantibacillus carotarum]